MTAPDDADIPMLIGLLAKTDAMFSPLRARFTLQRWAEIGWRRRQFRRLGLPGSGGAGQERLQAHRLYRRLARAGLVEIRGGGRAFGVRLSDQADWWLRRLATWHDQPQTLLLVGLVRWHELAGGSNAGFISEVHLAVAKPVESLTEEQALLVLQVEEIARPALVRGWLLSRSDHHCAAGYQATPAGRAALSCPPKLPAAMPKYSSEANDEYLAALDQAAAELAEARPQAHRHDVPVCLSCGLWPPRDPTLPALFNSRGRLRTGKELAAFVSK